MRLAYLGGLLVAATAAMGGCGKCSGTYNCPYDGAVFRLSVEDLPSAIVSVSADSPCTAMLVSSDGGSAAVWVNGDTSSSSSDCSVHA
jgi:hypothetical protein